MTTRISSVVVFNGCCNPEAATRRDVACQIHAPTTNELPASSTCILPSSINRTDTPFSILSPARPLLRNPCRRPPHPPPPWHITKKLVAAALSSRRTARTTSHSTWRKSSYVHLLVPPRYRLPHGWHMSNVGYAVLSAPEGEELRALIAERRAHLPAAQ
jgi:hypothetical protein